ncbi:hypothetical protein DUI87_09495 [Hirundo rustica rustica]|uniref:Uncharacterized protein n=1 Tax=Hirundo rustica rustica TaxID=333673 RepID=A0A3M0KMD0_HIRRU|nr:hypothetical protein DUI87_09495 [Hirundo rustica rustica]
MALSLAELKECLDDALGYMVQCLVVLNSRELKIVVGPFPVETVYDSVNNTLQWVFVAKEMMLFSLPRPTFGAHPLGYNTECHLERKAPGRILKPLVVLDSWS